MLDLQLPAPLPHQLPMLDSDARFKTWRAGRRTGKSRGGFIAGVAGHGPDRMRRGMLQGGDILWVAPDYPQSKAIWREEVRPRFAGRPWCVLNEVDRRVEIPGLGSLEIRSAEAIDGVRGRRLDGVLLDEAAYFDLEYAWNAVLRPALADRAGWAIFQSTTNAGFDGNAMRRVPSYFNLLCERAERGELGAEWAAFHNRTGDNPKLPAAEVAALYAEYPPGSATAAQELDADLHVQGGRFYALDADTHLVEPAALPSPRPAWWEVWGAFDWGFGHWAVFGLFAKAGHATFLLDSWWARRQQDEALADGCLALCAEHGVDPRRLTIYAGHDCWAKVTARGAPGITTADIFQRRGLRLRHADIDKLNGGRAMRRALAQATPQRDAGLYIVDVPPRPGERTSGNRRVFDQLAALVPDPNDVNKPAKVDADADGHGGDDGADMARYGVATRYREVKDRTPQEEPGAFDPAVLAAEAEASRKPLARRAQRRTIPSEFSGGY